MEFTQHERDLLSQFSQSQMELLLRLVNSVHGIKYGSITLTVHDGKVVEIQKTERMRVQK